MSSAPVLKLIDGGKTAEAGAATPPAADKNMRLYPALETGSGSAFGKTIAFSLILHGAAILVALSVNLFGGSQGASTNQEAILLDAIEIVLLDAMPNAPPPLAEAQPTEVADIEEPGVKEETAAPEAPTLLEMPAERIKPTPAETATAPIAETVSKAEPEIAAGPILTEPQPVKTDTAPKVPSEAPRETTAQPSPKTETPIAKASPAPRAPPKSNSGAASKKPKALGKAGLSKYQSKIAAHLRRYRRYPDAARRKGITGTAIVSFTINRGGRLVGASLAKGTGHAILDREALAMVRRATPFPAIPSSLGKSRVALRVPIRFDRR